jgi:hypothetical protein
VLLQELAPDSVQLTVQKMAAAVQQGDGHTTLAETFSGFQAKKASADDHRSPMAASRLNQGPGVFQVPESHDTRKIFAR